MSEDDLRPSLHLVAFPATPRKPSPLSLLRPDLMRAIDQLQVLVLTDLYVANNVITHFVNLVEKVTVHVTNAKGTGA